MVSATPKKAPWDQRLMESMAREAREAANDPVARRNPPLREQIKSPSYWLSLLATAVGVFLLNHATDGWTHALAAVLYLGGLVVLSGFRRDRTAMKEKP